jgi:NAD(P)-dependent dehydrogenase (short-subunit alcohol dehydrogenase family)
MSAKLEGCWSMRDVQGKTAIVTGAASGIGLGIATALATAGANIVLADLRVESLGAARKAIEATGARVATVVVDVSDPQSVEAAGKVALDSFGALHIAVNNAGVAMHGTPVESVTMQEWNWVIGVNVMGVINGIRTFVPMIRAHGQGGHVVNTGSVSSLFVREGRNQGAYAMTKYAVLALSEALEQELAGSDIGVSVLCPGGVRTSIFDSAATRPDRFGGSYQRPEQEAMKTAFAPAALDPDVVGRRVLQAIRDNEFYVLTHTAEREVISARFDRIRAAFDRADGIMPGLIGS